MAARSNKIRAAIAESQSPFYRVTQGIRILRLSQVIEITGLRKTKLYELQAAGEFPMRVQITPRSVGWVEGEIQAWLTQRVAARPHIFNPSLSRNSPEK
jgi:prophage regulatory protein